MTDAERNLRCELTVAARFACADIIGGAHTLYVCPGDGDAYEIERIRYALAELNKAFNAAFPAVTP